MLISKEIEILLISRNIKKTIEKYSLLNSVKVGDIVKIPIEKISSNSHVIVTVTCDYCKSELSIPYSAYTLHTKVVNKVSCSNKSCSNKKIKDVCLKKYGVENVFQSEEIKLKSKVTNLEKYGVEYSSMSDEFKYNLRKTNLEKYGVENVFQSEEIKLKSKVTNLEKYGVENVFQSEIIKNKIKETCIIKYDVNHPLKSNYIKSKMNETNLEKYGVENVFQSEIIKNKIKETCIIKYGVGHPMFLEETKFKIKKTCIEKYGVDNFTKTDEYKVKTINTNLERYGVIHHAKTESSHSSTKISNNVNYIKYLDDSISLFRCEKGHTFEISTSNYFNRQNIPLCTVCYPIGDHKSIKEKELLEYIKSLYSGEVISSYRNRLEIDIYLPELNIGFEFNGLYWHSSKFKEKNYHIDKTDYFKKKGIRIIHIWEDDWILRKGIVKSQIDNLLMLNSKNIFARRCLVKEVSIKDCKQFLDNNHIQGAVSSTIKIGLYYNDELVSLMTFNSSEGRKKMEEGGWNLNRFCNKCDVNVVGGASKLLSHFIKNYDVKRIVSYADKDWSVGNLYEVLGFNNIGGNGPDYKYIVDGCRVHKSRYKKSKLNTNLTESQEMLKRGIYKIYDCGKLKFEMKLVY